MALPSGFVGERMSIVPRPLVAAALRRPVTQHLVVTDAGWYPHALGHARYRRHGAPEEIVIACTEGDGWAVVDGVPLQVRPGDVLVLPSGVPHSYGADPNTPWTIWWCHLRGADAAELRASAADRPLIALRQPDRVVALLDEIVAHLERDHGTASLVGATGAAWKLFTQLAIDQQLPARDDPAHRAMAFIGDRLDADLGVPEIAALVGVSPSHLGALFRRATGGGVLAYRTGLRMARARTLLDRTDATVAEVARAVGFDDPLYFSRQFRRRHGISPTAYRAANHGG